MTALIGVVVMMVMMMMISQNDDVAYSDVSRKNFPSCVWKAVRYRSDSRSASWTAATTAVTAVGVVAAVMMMMMMMVECSHL